MQSVSEGAEESTYTANIAVGTRHIRRNRAYQFVLEVRFGSGEVGANKYFVAIFKYFLGIVMPFTPAALDSAQGMRQLSPRVWNLVSLAEIWTSKYNDSLLWDY